jgi:outer membrane protein, multidrug efflux system
MGLAVAGCTSLPPDTNEPSAVVPPARWQALDAPGAAAATPTELAAWWQAFGDADLSRWTQRAQQGSPRVAAAEAAWRQAAAQRDAAAAAQSPTLGATASAGRDGSGQGDTRRSDERFQLGLDGRWVPDVFGAARRALAAADAAEQARRASLGDVRVQVAGDAALAYIALRTQQVRLALARDTLASQRQTLQITDWRQQAGLVNTLQTDQARAAVAQTEALLPALQTAIAQSRHTLALLAGQPFEAADALADEAAASVPAVPAAAEALALDIPATTLRQRADVRAAELDVAAALSRVGQAEAQRWPSFAIGGSIGLNALTLGALGDGASLVSSLLASVSLPLFDGGARRAQVRVQQAALEQARALHRGVVLGALKEVEDALVALQGDRLRLASLGTAAAAAANAAQLARLRFNSGLVDFQIVLDTQRTAFSAEDAVVGARADLARDHVQLYRALGGGWRAAPALAAQAPTP